MRKNRVILWFRQDLRLHDNEALQEAMSHGEEILPVYVFDERTFTGETMFGFPKTGVHRARFIIESVQCLRRQLRRIGSELIVRTGRPEDVIFDIAHSAKTSWVFCNRERTHEEIQVQDALEKNLWSIGQEVRFSRGKMLFYTADLPFPVTHTPDHFTTFRKETERLVPIRRPFDPPERLVPYAYDIDPGSIPTLAELGFTGLSKPPLFKGGEEAALAHLDMLRQSRMPAAQLAGDGHTQLSPWLSQGCLSPKHLYCSIPALRKIDPDLAEGALTGLLYRDYLRLMGKKYGNTIFLQSGVQGEKPAVAESDMDLFRIWARGHTGLPIIDAAMHQLNETGFIPHRARALTAHFLVKELGSAWRLGASYFESMLIDYDPCSNWVNWGNLAGVGPDSRDERKINFVLQAKRLDPDGAYVKRWIPALEKADQQWLHQPDQASDEQLKASSITLGKDYPVAVLSSSRWHALSG